MSTSAITMRPPFTKYGFGPPQKNHPFRGASRLPEKYTRLTHIQKTNAPRHTPDDQHAKLNADELAFLLGCEAESKKRIPLISSSADAFVSLLNALHKRLPSKSIGYSLLLLFPFALILGSELFKWMFGSTAYLLFTLLTAILGILLLRGQGSGWLSPAIKSLRAGRVPPFTLLHKGLITLCGLFLLLPSPFIDGLAIFALLPPVSRLATVLLARIVKTAISFSSVNA